MALKIHFDLSTAWLAVPSFWLCDTAWLVVKNGRRLDGVFLFETWAYKLNGVSKLERIN